MKKIFLLTILFLSLTSTLLAVDENTYIRFTADSIIVAHNFKGNPNAAELWTNEMQKRYPDFMNQDWESFERRLKKDEGLKRRVTSAILQNIRSRGYTANIVDLGGGATTVEIQD